MSLRVGEVPSGRVEPLLGGLREEGLLTVGDHTDGVWLAALDGDAIAGVARVIARGDLHLLDDLWVPPDGRGRGVASALLASARGRHRPLWLVCDEDAVGFYARRGFTRVAPESFPPRLAALYAALGEWPGSDHVHVAMVAG